MTYNTIFKRISMLSVFLFAATIGCKEKKETKTVETDIKIEKPVGAEVLIGTYTQEDSQGIYKAFFDEKTGILSKPELLVETENPTFLCQSQDKKSVYAVNAVKEGRTTSFRWNEDRTRLTPISEKLTGGSGPCHITLNKAQNLVAISNYGSGTFTLLKTNAQGELLEEAQVRNHKGSGPVLPAQASARAHYATFGANDRYAYVVDLGIDKVLAYPVDANGEIGSEQTALQMDPGDGPRHMVFHPSKDMAFIINEHSNSVVSVSVNHDTGTFTRIDKKSTLPENYTDPSFCADIHISADGKFLYGSNRGHNSIAVFSVSDDGTLDLIDNVSVSGDWPRNFALSPNGDHMLVANQKSNNITVFKIDAKTGIPTYTGQEIALSMPVCLKF